MRKGSWQTSSKSMKGKMVNKRKYWNRSPSSKTSNNQKTETPAETERKRPFCSPPIPIRVHSVFRLSGCCGGPVFRLSGCCGGPGFQYSDCTILRSSEIPIFRNSRVICVGFFMGKVPVLRFSGSPDLRFPVTRFLQFSYFPVLRLLKILFHQSLWEADDFLPRTLWLLKRVSSGCVGSACGVWCFYRQPTWVCFGCVDEVARVEKRRESSHDVASYSSLFLSNPKRIICESSIISSVSFLLFFLFFSGRFFVDFLSFLFWKILFSPFSPFSSFFSS